MSRCRIYYPDVNFSSRSGASGFYIAPVARHYPGYALLSAKMMPLEQTRTEVVIFLTW